MGIEPTQPAWKAGTLPLSYTRICKIDLYYPRNDLVEGVGFEPTNARCGQIYSLLPLATWLSLLLSAR